MTNEPKVDHGTTTISNVVVDGRTVPLIAPVDILIDSTRYRDIMFFDMLQAQIDLLNIRLKDLESPKHNVFVRIWRRITSKFKRGNRNDETI